MTGQPPTKALVLGLFLLPMGILLEPVAGQAQTQSAAQRQIESAQTGEFAKGPGALPISELLMELGVPGASIAVIRDFDIHWAKAYGIADTVSGRAVAADTLFQAASISKPVAAMASLKAVQEGKFSLEDDVNDLLVSWSLDGEGMTDERPVTPAALLSHTSGLGDAFGFPGYKPGDPLPTTIEILEGQPPSNVRRIFMEREPGIAYEYSGGGVTLQELVLRDVYKKPFSTIMAEHVLRPLGMHDSSYRQPLPDDRAAKAARAHSAKGKAMEAPWHVYPELAAAGLWTTPSDLARFVIEVQKSVRGTSNRVLNASHARRMITPVGVGLFAIGFGIEKKGEGWYFSHDGANWGFRAFLIGHVSKGYGLAVMTNSDSGTAFIEELSRRVQRAYHWDALDEAVPRGYRALDLQEIAVPLNRGT